MDFKKNKRYSMVQSFPNLQFGLSLIELMVALVIGLVVSTAIYSVITVSEGRKRTTTSVNDIDKAGAYALFQMDQAIRSAGSGYIGGANSGAYIQAASYTMGCQINASLKNTQILPSQSLLPAPFNALPKPLDKAPINFRLAPAIILAGGAGTGGDVLITMAGNSGLAETATNFSSVTASASSLNIANVVNMGINDIVLVAGPPAASMSPCLIQQVSSSFKLEALVTALPLAGDYYESSVNGLSITSYPVKSIVVNLGKEPAFNLFGVGANNTLFKYNLLNLAIKPTEDNPNPSPFVDGVYQMRALYGVYTTPNNPSTLDWKAPIDDYSAENLLAGTPAAINTLSNIKAIKIGLVMKTSLPEKSKDGDVSGKSLILFGNTKVPVEVALTERNYRYRAVEVTVPIRNSLML